MLTLKDFEIFETEVLKYQKMLNLLDWDITFCFDKFGNKFQSEASWYFKNRMVYFRLEKDQNLSKKMLRKIARHEIFHLFDSEIQKLIPKEKQEESLLIMEKRAIVLEKYDLKEV